MSRGKERPFKDKCGYTEGYKEEIVDSTPVDAMLHRAKPETLQQMVARLVVNSQMQRELQNAGFETFEEANDFDVHDEFMDPETPYEALYQVEEMMKAEALEAKKEKARIEAETKIKQKVRKNWSKKETQETLSKSKKTSRKVEEDED